MATLRYLWHDAETVGPIRGTAWGAYQVVTEYIDHFAPVKTREDAGDARALRLLTTEGPSRVKAQAWKRLAPTARRSGQGGGAVRSFPFAVDRGG